MLVAVSRYEVDVSAEVLWLSQSHWYADWVTTRQVWPCHKWAVRVSAHHTFVSLSHCHTVTLPCNIGLTEALRSSQEIIRHPNKCNMDNIQGLSVYMVFPSVRPAGAWPADQFVWKCFISLRVTLAHWSSATAHVSILLVLRKWEEWKSWNNSFMFTFDMIRQSLECLAGWTRPARIILWWWVEQEQNILECFKRK